MYKVEGLEFCLEGLRISADDLEILMIKAIWQNRNYLPVGLLVTRWNGFGYNGRTTVFQFFVTQGTNHVFTVNQGSHDHCLLRPLVDNWAKQLGAVSWGRFEEIVVDEPFLLFDGSLTLYFSKYRLNSLLINKFLHSDFGIPLNIEQVPEGCEYWTGGIYSR